MFQHGFFDSFCLHKFLFLATPQHSTISEDISPIHIPPGHLKLRTALHGTHGSSLTNPEGKVSEQCGNNGTIREEHTGKEKERQACLVYTIGIYDVKREQTKKFNTVRWEKSVKKRWEREWYGREMKSSFWSRTEKENFHGPVIKHSLLQLEQHQGVSRGVTSP